MVQSQLCDPRDLRIREYYTSQVACDGESNWLKGVQLIAVYVILGIVFFFSS